MIQWKIRPNAYTNFRVQHLLDNQTRPCALHHVHGVHLLCPTALPRSTPVVRPDGETIFLPSGVAGRGRRDGPRQNPLVRGRIINLEVESKLKITPFLRNREQGIVYSLTLGQLALVV